MKLKISPDLLHSLSTQRYLAYIRSLPNFHSEKVQSYATVILTLLAFIIFGVFAIGPTLSTISELRKKLDDNKYIDLQLQNKITNMTQLQSSYTSLSSKLPILHSAIPRTPDASKLSGQIRTLAREHSVELTQLQVQNLEIAGVEASLNSLKPIPVTIAAQGDIPDLQKFYAALISFDRILTIDAFTLLLPSESEASSYRVVIRASAYYKP